jgi:hypothetical protein
MLTLKPQEVPFDSVESNNMFQPSAEKPLLATPGAIQEHTLERIVACLERLQHLAKVHNGIDYLEVFENDDGPDLWFIEDGEGGAITALLPSEY